jgi:hypothetical protein
MRKKLVALCSSMTAAKIQSLKRPAALHRSSTPIRAQMKPLQSDTERMRGMIMCWTSESQTITEIVIRTAREAIQRVWGLAGRIRTGARHCR